jgi:hypothetical protein
MADSRDWTASGKKPEAGASAARVRVSGEVDLPDQGASADLVEDRAGINPDILMLRVVVTRGKGQSAQVITPTRVEWEDEVRSSTVDVHVIDHAQLTIDWQ